MKYKFNRMLSLLLCIVVIYSTSLVNVAYSVDLQKNVVHNSQVMYFENESHRDVCKIKRKTATVTINTFEKVELYADYSVYSNENYELLWSVDGKSYFLNGGIDKTTTGTNVKLLFLDDTTIKLQIVSSNGDVLCEDEIFLKSYRNKETPFLAKLQSWILLPIIVFIGVIGGTIGPWIGSIL